MGIAGIRLFVITALIAHSVATADEAIPLYVGTGATAIYRCEFDPDSGALTEPQIAAETPRPTFLSVRPDGSTLYSISELYGSADGGPAIVAWALDDPPGRLLERNRQPAPGDGPCFVAVREDGRFAAIANYGGGSVALYPIRPDGSLDPASGQVQHRGSSIDPRRQGEPHAHSIRFDPSGSRLVAADLGTDRVYLYQIDPTQALSVAEPASVKLPAGSGPRHLVFSPSGEDLFVLGELSGTITRFAYDPPQVELAETISTMAPSTPLDAPRGSAEILFHPSGRFVYASNRGPSEIAVFAFDPKTRTLKRTFAASSGGQTPRNFRFSPDGRFLIVANQASDRLNVFSVDPQTGEFEPTDISVSVPKPMCLKFVTPQR